MKPNIEKRNYLFQQNLDTRFEKLTRFQKDAPRQSILNGGVLPNTDNIYFPPKFADGTKFKDIFVTLDNLKECTEILEEYYKKHGVFAMTHDFEVFPDYNFPKQFIEKYAKKYGIDLTDKLALAKKYFGNHLTTNDLKYSPLLVDKSTRYALDEIITKIAQTENLNLDEHKIQVDYEIDDYDLITIEISAKQLAAVALVLDKDVFVDLKQIITTLLTEKINVLNENWFKTFLAKKQTVLLAKFSELSPEKKDTFLFNAGLAKDTNAENLVNRLNSIADDNETITWALKKAPLSAFIIKYNKLSANKLAPWFNSDKTVSSIENRINIVQALIDEKASFSRFVTQSLDHYFYPFFTDTFTIDGYNFIFLENQIVNAGASNAKSYVNKADGYKAWWYFRQNLVVNAEKAVVYDVNGGGYDNEIEKRLLTFESPYKYNYRSINSKNKEMKSLKRGGREILEYKIQKTDIANYLKRFNDEINDKAGFLALDLTYLQTARDGKYLKPYLNFNEQQLVDVLKESKPGAKTEDEGVGLKTYQSNMGLAIKEGTSVYQTQDGTFAESQGLSFSAKNITDITDENLHATIEYNKNDTLSTIAYAIQYKSNQQKAKNAVLNLGGQGANLFTIKDRGVLLLLQNNDLVKEWNFALETDAKTQTVFFKTFFLPLINALKTKQFDLLQLSPLGVNEFLTRYLAWESTADEKTKAQHLAWLTANYKANLIGVIYRYYYWTANKSNTANNVAYPEFGAINPTHRYNDTFVIDLQKPTLTIAEKEKLFAELTKDDPVYYTSDTGLVLRNDAFKEFIKKATNGSKFTKTQTDLLVLILNTYTQYQDSDVAVNQEFSKLRQTALYLSTTVGQLIQIVADNKIPLSPLNPRWDPKSKLNTESKYSWAENYDDTQHPIYQRVKYLYEFKSMDEAHLTKVEKDENKKPYFDANQDNFLYFQFQTPVLYDENNADEKEINNANKYYDKRIIYRTKAPEFMDSERSKAAAHFNKTGENYKSFSGIWYKTFLKDGIKLIYNNKEYIVPVAEFTNVKNWTTERVQEFTDGHVLNREDYGRLIFNYADAKWVLNGLSLIWDENTETFADKLLEITPYELKYTQKSFDDYNNGEEKVRFETGIKIIDEKSNEYNFRLDVLQPALLNEQVKLFTKEEGKETTTKLFAIDATTNLDLDNSLHEWNYKKGLNKKLMADVAAWESEHPEFRFSKGRELVNNKFYVLLKNSYNDTLTYKTEKERINFTNKETLATMIAGGIHGDSQFWFDDSDRNIFCVDADQTSFYPWILLSFIQVLNTFNPLWYKDAYELNITLKRIGDAVTRLGLKLDVNGITGKINELKSILASVPVGTNLLRTGQLQNLQMHTVLAKLMRQAGEPFVARNINTDGNEYEVTKRGAQILNDFCNDLFMRRFSEEAIADFKQKWPEIDLTKVLDLELMRTWSQAVDKSPYHELWRNTVEMARAMNMCWQVTVNQFIGYISTISTDKVKDKSKNPALYAVYEKYCQVEDKDDCDIVRRKVIDIYKTKRDNLPPEFDLRIIYDNFITKGFLQNWNIIMQLEQAKKENKILNNEQYAKFGTGPILDFAIVERIAFNVPIKNSLKRFKDLTYFAFNAKRTESYDESIFTNLNGEATSLDKNTRYLVAKSRDKKVIGNISKVKHYQTEHFDTGAMLDFFALNKVPYNNQQSLQKFARDLNAMAVAVGLEPFCELKFVGLVDNEKEIYAIKFDAERFFKETKQWDILRKSMKYTTQTGKTELVWTLKRIKERLASLSGLENDDKELAGAFSAVLKENGHDDFIVRLKRDLISKFPGSVVVSDDVDENGYYTGNFLINENLNDFKITETGNILKYDYTKNEFVDTGAFLDYDFYEASALYGCYNIQKPFVKKETQSKTWFMQPAELAQLWRQNYVDPRWNKTDEKVKAFCAANGIDLTENKKAYASNDFTLDDDENLTDESVESAENAVTKTSKKVEKVAETPEINDETVDLFKKLLFLK